MSDKAVPVSFMCKRCRGIMTLGVVGGREALTGPPPSCLYCGHEELEDVETPGHHEGVMGV